MLGVISQDTAENAALRTVNRNTWMRGGTQSGILARFVMRGIGLSARALQEARAHGDTVFVSAPSVTSYKTVRQQIFDRAVGRSLGAGCLGAGAGSGLSASFPGAAPIAARLVALRARRVAARAAYRQG